MMRKLTALIAAALLAPAASAGSPHPPAPHAQHAYYKRLCSSVRFTIPIPAGGNIYVDEWVNGKEITAWGDGPKIIYFFGKNVSGRWVQTGTRTSLVQAVHFVPGCVSLKVAWQRQ